MLADVVDAVVGADTHRDLHALEMITPAGVTVATLTISNTAAGYARALAWISEHAPGPCLAVAVEGTRSYGIGLARAAAAAGLPVLEVEQPHRRDRRRGKSDPIDARLAALRALRLDVDRLPTPRTDGDREALRILLGARRDLTNTKTRAINQLRALLLTGSDEDRALNPIGEFTQQQLGRIARRRGSVDERREHSVRRVEARRLAVLIRDTDRELAANVKQLTSIVHDLAPTLLTRRGIGPVTAAQAVVSWSHHGRCRNDAAFAALAGASPLPASSGRVVHYRLNRGGDRALNKALHHIVQVRTRCCPRTRAYIARRRAEGRSDGNIRRCLKRYIAREIFRTLNATARGNPFEALDKT